VFGSGLLVVLGHTGGGATADVGGVSLVRGSR
jgi:hypothetical protein